MYDAAGRQRKATSGDTSLVSPTRPENIVDVTKASISFGPIFSYKNSNDHDISTYEQTKT